MDAKDENQLIKLAAYTYPYEAHIAKAVLEANGILAFVFDDEMNYTNWLYGIALGGVRLMVRRGDWERAKALLDAPNSLNDQEEASKNEE